MIVEFQDEDSVAFEEVMTVLKRYPNFESISLNEETVISLPGLTIYPEQRKIYRDRQEIHLTAKEYDAIYGNLREKLFQTSPSTSFNIRCVREVGYCLETE